MTASTAGSAYPPRRPARDRGGELRGNVGVPPAVERHLHPLGSPSYFRFLGHRSADPRWPTYQVVGATFPETCPDDPSNEPWGQRATGQPGGAAPAAAEGGIATGRAGRPVVVAALPAAGGGADRRRAGRRRGDGCPLTEPTTGVRSPGGVILDPLSTALPPSGPARTRPVGMAVLGCSALLRRLPVSYGRLGRWMVIEPLLAFGGRYVEGGTRRRGSPRPAGPQSRRVRAVLASPTARPPEIGRGRPVLRDRWGTAVLRRPLRAAPATAREYLVRPDGYLGYRCAGFDLADLQRHMTRWLPRMPSSAPPQGTRAGATATT